MATNAEYQRRWYEKNKKLQIERNEANKKKKKEFVKQYKSDRGCSRCSEKDVACLQFHHINPDEKEACIHTFIKRNLSIENIMKEINKCEVICANCHFKLHKELDKPE